MTKIKLKQQLLCFSLLFTCLLQAQITKTNWLVGGNASFGNSKSETISSTGAVSDSEFSYIKLEPNIGYFLVDKLAVGLSTGIDANFNKKNTFFIYYGGPFVRYYWLKPENRINFLTHVQYTFSADNKSSSKTNVFNAKVGPVIYFNSSVGLEMTLSYLNYKNTFNDTSQSNQGLIALNVGLQIHLDK